VLIENVHPRPWNEKWDLIIPGDQNTTITFCVEHFLAIGNNAIKKHGRFSVALSGGSTPQAIFEKLTHTPFKNNLDWSKVLLFWSDERSVPPDHRESNYRMAMDAGFKDLPIPSSQIFRMQAETDIENHALEYEYTLKTVLNNQPLDLCMLGMGEDGHTASLFPRTKGLNVKDRLVIANYLPEQNTWRMTLTYPCINSASHIAIYIIGASKKHMLAQVFQSKEKHLYPIQDIGTPEHKALWVIDEAAADLLKKAV